MVATTDRYTFARFSHDFRTMEIPSIHCAARVPGLSSARSFARFSHEKKEQGGFSTVVTMLISPHLDMSALRRKYGIVFTVIGFALMIAGAIMGAYNLLK